MMLAGARATRLDNWQLRWYRALASTNLREKTMKQKMLSAVVVLAMTAFSVTRAQKANKCS